ncbi:Crp/Fnr family transcriptional regulator [Roseinatronobacter monicus]|uniref:CRP-like cAMP-binding protein n=1 Tax=Roseinatronobacter monicus TaxID=393481 RepID=A0A543KGC7_9RHOB|nr:Crp/Fnr family transcriptional regulator [Roseinatronobacter monicus]TQM94136.1 CRP-like cAMP-binding protein [Roseinatronobacter monicus]
MHPCETCALRKKELFSPFSESDLKFMKEFRTGDVTLQAGEILHNEGDENAFFYTAKEGQGAHFKHLANGDRQLVNFIFPGDVVGLQALLSGAAATTAIAASPMLLCRFHKHKLAALFRDNPERAYALTWISAVEQHFLGETIATLGQRSAAQRMAWALLKIHTRLSAVGLAPNGVAAFPFKQRDLADALGLSLVHTNKTLAKLRPYVTWDHGELHVFDKNVLADIALTDHEAPQRRPLL